MSEGHDHDHDDRPSAAFLALMAAIVGVMVLRLSIGEGYKAFVRPGMRPLLLVAAGVLVALAIGDAWVHRRPSRPHLVLVPPIGTDDRTDEDHAHAHDEEPHGHDASASRERADGHGHHHGAWPAVLMLAPVLLALGIAPRPLGSFAAGRSNVVPSPASPFSQLDEASGPAAISLLEFNQRALDRGAETLRDKPVRLTGFVMAGNPLRMARFRVACCAADGQAAEVELVGLDSRPAADHWIVVDGKFDSMDGDIPRLGVESVQLIGAPTDPYEPN